MDSDTTSEGVRQDAAFCMTHWTMVLNAARQGTAQNQEAFAQIYRAYWYPLYVYIRRRGNSPTDAEDVTQSFFLHIIEKQALEGLEREGGKFRSFLLRSLDNFLANAWHRAQAQKRGGGVQPLSLNLDQAETRFVMEPPTTDTPESIFERQWVCTLLANVLDRLRDECEANGKGPLFADLQPNLQGDRNGRPYAEVAARHQMSEGAVKVAVHRLRQRYGELLREEIARTVSRPEEVDEELRRLLSVAGS